LIKYLIRTGIRKDSIQILNLRYRGGVSID